MLLIYTVWFGSIALGWWLWTGILGRPPPDMLAFEAFVALGTLLIALSDRFGPVLPFQGRAPEETAADAFFKKQDVRSDDHDFERDLEP